MSDHDHTVDGNDLEAEARALVDRFNDAKEDYSPELEWFGMSVDHETKEPEFVFEADGYVDSDGLSALRECGRAVRYIEAHELDGDVVIGIHLRVHGEVPEREPGGEP